MASAGNGFLEKLKFSQKKYSLLVKPFLLQLWFLIVFRWGSLPKTKITF